jgi:hypothetical protein
MATIQIDIPRSTELCDWDHLTQDVRLWTTVPWTGDERLAKVKCGGDRGTDFSSNGRATGVLADTGYAMPAIDYVCTSTCGLSTASSS